MTELLTSNFKYDLPPELIAQQPAPERDGSRLLVLERETGKIHHSNFRELPSFLSEGDLVILNNTRVIPARLFGTRSSTGGKVEILLLEPMEQDGNIWRAFTKSGGKLRAGEELNLAEGELTARLAERKDEFGDILELTCVRPLADILAECGHMPVPPYIKRKDIATPSELDNERYQTTYAEHEGAVAAPTAGLHFTEDVFSELTRKNIDHAFITLHVGPGTFRPITTDNLKNHKMDSENYVISDEVAEKIKLCRARGGRVIAVGTTSVRTLETAATKERTVEAGEGVASLFIHPGYEFRMIDALITNFHQSEGTPLVLTSAFAGREHVMAAYAEAVNEKYRFLSYGDSMLVI